MSSHTATAKAPTTGVYTHRQILTILSGLMLGMFLAALDQTIVGTAIRTIADDLHGLDIQAWVTTAYLITSTITTPIYGKLGDLYGRKKLFLFAISVFIIGSAACSFATSMYMLAAFRAFQGIGAGGLMTLVLAIIGDIVSPRERAKYTGYFMATFATSSVLGPVIGGFFAQTSSLLTISGWRWVFLVNVPIGIVALFVVNHTLHLHHVRREARIDWWGAVCLVIGLVPLLMVAEQGESWGWASATSLVCYVVGVLGLVSFTLVEKAMGDNALIPLRIFKIRAASVTIVASVIVGLAMFGGIIVLPQYMQIVHGASPMTSGFMMLPMVGGLMIAAVVSGLITARTGIIRIFPIIGTLIATCALALLFTIGADTSLTLVMAYMFVLGVGLGNCMQPLTIIVQNAVPPREIGVATSAATFFRQTGGTLGVAIFLSILFSTVGTKMGDALKVAATSPQFVRQAIDSQVLLQQHGTVVPNTRLLAGVQSDSSILARLPSVVAHPFKVGFADSMDLVFITAAGIMLIGFLIMLLMPKIVLRDKSAIAEAAAASEAGERVGAGVSAGHLGDELPDEPGHSGAALTDYRPRHGG